MINAFDRKQCMDHAIYLTVLARDLEEMDMVETAKDTKTAGHYIMQLLHEIETLEKKGLNQ